MIIDLINHNIKKTLALKADIAKRFDTRINILNDLPNRINLD